MNNFKCRFCKVCMGDGCVGQMPGMGGLYDNKNFRLNCRGWKKLRDAADAEGRLDELMAVEVTGEKVLCAPITGAVQNIGYENEADFYLPYLSAAYRAGIGMCVGDGTPDEKLMLGLNAVKALKAREGNADIQAAVFIKPYTTDMMMQRAQWSWGAAGVIGCDIDACNIATMAGTGVVLERKTVHDLKMFRNVLGVPLAVKGVFSMNDIELVRMLHPDICYISNHGGRVDALIGSTADFLAAHCGELRLFCDEVWVDGGIRCREDVQTALFYGADRVVVGRPIISALCKGGEDAAIKAIKAIVG